MVTQPTHYRCGGNLISIDAPGWAPHKRGGFNNFAGDHLVQEALIPEYARCDRCGLPGELAPIPEPPR